ncbi:MAG TPA: rhomboid family protein [Chthoniobacterales bacterium]|nr:rhomboid family protein [Chthoniobacterales bacterium]
MKVSRAQRCVHHPDREAAARCPECSRFFCRECVSEHDDRVLCASCLAAGLRVRAPGRSRFSPLGRALAAVLGLCLAWWFFDLVAQGLMRLPASVHEGSIWENISIE